MRDETSEGNERQIPRPGGGSGDEPYAADGTFATEALANLAWSLSIVARRLQNALKARESGSSQDNSPEIPDGYMMRINHAVAAAESAANKAEAFSRRSRDAADSADLRVGKAEGAVAKCEANVHRCEAAANKAEDSERGAADRACAIVKEGRAFLDRAEHFANRAEYAARHAEHIVKAT